MGLCWLKYIEEYSYLIHPWLNGNLQIELFFGLSLIFFECYLKPRQIEIGFASRIPLIGGLQPISTDTDNNIHLVHKWRLNDYSFI